jgi:NitT/TauT family transport system substrate-binding protein
MKVRWGLLLVLCLALLAGAGCGGDDEDAPADPSGADSGEEQQGGAPEKVTLLLPFQESIFYYGITIAREQGYFEEEGLDVETQASEGSAFVTQQIVGGGVEFGTNTPAETLVALEKGLDVKVIAGLYYAPVFSINVLEDSPIQSVADLEGKTLGITDAGGGEVPLVRSVLAAEGLGYDEDVKIQVVGPGGALAVNSLKDGKVDAFAGAINDFAGLEAKGLKLRSILPDDFETQPGDSLMVRTETYEDQAKMDQAVGMMRAINKGMYFGSLNEDAGLCTMKEFLPEEHEDPAFARLYYQRAVELMTPEDPENWGEILFPNWEFIMDLLVEAGGEEGLEEPVDLEQYLTNEFVEQYNDWDRSEVEQDAEQATLKYPAC